MDNTEIIRELSETTALAHHNELQIAEVKDELAEIKKDNKALYDIVTSVKIIAQDMTYIKKDIETVKTNQTDLREQISDLRSSPNKAKAQWWDKAIGAVCGAIGMAILGYVLSNIFPVLFK